MSSFHSRTTTWKLATRGQRVGEIGQLVVVRREDRLRARRGFDARCSATAQARLRPSNVDVPRPISSRMTRLRDVALCRMFAVSCISTMNVDWPRAMLSDAPTRANRRSTTGSFAVRAGTNEPACAIRQSSARLAQVGRLAAHVRAGQDDQLVRGGVERDVVRDERVGDVALDDRMARVGRDELVAGVHLRLGVVLDRRRLGERARARRATRAPRAVSCTRGASAATRRAQRLEDLELALEDALVGAEDLLLVLLERRRDESLAAGDRLLAVVVGRHACQVRPRDLDVVAEDPVVADLQRRDAGPRALGFFHLGDALLARIG